MSDENASPETPVEGSIVDQYLPQTNAGEDGVEEVVAAPVNRNEATGVITVTCGANVQTFGDISGCSVGALRTDLADVLNIAPDAKAIVSGAEVDDDYVLNPGDRVEFIKASGNKG